MGKDVIIACDFSSKDDVMRFLGKFSGRKPFVKIGMELFYSEGPGIVSEIKERGHRIFLDLKLHDIPNTVKKTMSVLSSIGADICNLHAAGGSEMMKAAVEGLTREDGTRPLLIAVTQLTSTDQKTLENELLIDKKMEDVVLSYALNAKNSGLDGIVCSPWETAIVHRTLGRDFLTVTPGIRFGTASSGDQKRIMTPAMARSEGSDYIVVGRPITASEDPVGSYMKCCEDFIDV